jgi:hypothetical protein
MLNYIKAYLDSRLMLNVKGVKINLIEFYFYFYFWLLMIETKEKPNR